MEARSYYQCNKLKEYLRLEGIDWVKYKKDNAVIKKLKENPKLQNMSMEKLKAAIEKK